MKESSLNVPQKLGFKKKLGYSIGQMGDSIGFNVFQFFFLFFLTDIAGVPPAIAGTISLIGVLWDAITDPICGFVSDNLRTKWGRRRPLMLASSIPYAVCTFLLFHNIDMDSSAKCIYFIIMAMLFWTAYTMYVIPYFALGAELTQDYEERNSLRSWASVFIYLAVMLASATPPLIVSQVEKMGGSTIDGWNTVGILFGALIFIVIVICCISTKGGEIYSDYQKEKKEKEEENRGEKVNIFKNFVEIFKLKPTKSLAATVFIWSFVSAMYNAMLVYLMTNNLGYSAGLQSTYFFLMSAIAIVQVPFINYAANKWGKKGTYIGTTLFSGIGFIVFLFIGFPSFAFMIVYAVVVMLGTTTYWTLYYSMMYDISEVDEFVNGKRREGSITSIMSFSQKLGSAVALQAVGIFLQMGGYDASLEVQSESALQAIMQLNTLVPGIIGVLGAVVMFAYPLTGERFEKLKAALEAKKKGEEYTTEGFEKLL